MSTPLSDNFTPEPTGFQAVAQTLLHAITSGDLAPGSQLPSINELARRHATTAITIRRALRCLEEAGLIRVEHGVGTFVADWRAAYDLLPSFSRQMAARRLEVHTEIVARDLAIHYPIAADALGLEPDTPLARLTRVRRIGAVPLVFQHSYLEPEFRSLVQEFDPAQSLYDGITRRTGRAPFSSDETIRAFPLPADAAAALHQPEGTIGWFAPRTTRDAANKPLVFDEAYFPAHGIEFHVRRQAGQALLELRISESALEG